MKREILFRGLTKKDNKMIYGDVRQFSNGDIKIVREFEYTDILPETLSQYTGKKDKYGNKIFEGDVMLYSFSDEKSGFKISDMVLVQWEEDYAGFYTFSSKLHGEAKLSVVTEKVYEVVGNIFEDPEYSKVFKKTRNPI